MHDTLISIPGPVFLGLYIIIWLAALLGGKLLTKVDNSMDWRMPEPTRFPPTAIAAFAGGPAEAVRNTIFQMVEKKILMVSGDPPMTRVSRAGKSESKLTDPVERLIYDHLNTACSPRDILSDKSLIKSVDRSLSHYYDEFETHRLLRNDADRLWIWLITLGGTGIVTLIGGLKLFLGISRGKPSGFLLILVPIAIVSIFFFLMPKPHSKTRLGQAYLNKLSDHFDWLKGACSSGTVPDGIDPALPLALYGPGVLAGLGAYTIFSTAFTPPAGAGSKNSSSFGGCGAGCGTGCSSGCGGGGGCGGGCGGCGGCG